MSARTAAQLRSAMQTVVDAGTGSHAKIGGLTVGGKTGTAQRDVDNSARRGAGGGRRGALAVRGAS